MKAATKGTIIRICIPLLRLFPTYAALLGFAALYDFGAKTFIVYAAPLQKVFYSPIVLFAWGALALIPFIVLRSATVFRIYATLFLGCLAFMAYDYFVPFRYISPNFDGAVDGGGYSTAGNKENIDFWVSHPIFPPSGEDIFVALVRVTPLALAFAYRRYHHLWSNRAQQNAAVGLRGADEVFRNGTP